MPGKRKPFSRELYNQYDSLAKQTMRKHLESRGHIVVVPPENYGVDLQSHLPENKLVQFYHEVEVSSNWATGGFPWITGSIPARKKRLMSLIDGPLFYWRFRHDLKRVIVYPSWALKDKYLVEVSNKYVEHDEYFYRIPIRLGKEFYVEGD
jgi:hypothetical protein